MSFNKIHIHPFFKTYGAYDDYDLAILSFTQPIRKFSNVLAPICVPESSKFNSIYQNGRHYMIFKGRMLEEVKQKLQDGEQLMRTSWKCHLI